ncbi:MAG: hypothetical protein ACHQRM_15465 [Bacteroidia bacterium]
MSRISFQFLWGIRPLFSLCLVLCIIHADNAQEKGLPDKRDSLYTPIRSSLWGTSEGKGKSDGAFFRNAFELNLEPFIRSIAAIQYERRLAPIFSLEGSLGLVYGSDPLLHNESNAMDFMSNSATSSMHLGIILDKATYSGGGFFYSFSLRLYYTASGWASNWHTTNDAFGRPHSYYADDGLDHSHAAYLEVGMRSYSYHVKVSGDWETSPIAGNPEMLISNFVYYVNTGWHFAPDWNVKTTHNFYLGIGLQKTTYNVFKLTTYNASPSGYEHVMSSARETTGLPELLFGYELGFGF